MPPSATLALPAPPAPLASPATPWRRAQRRAVASLHRFVARWYLRKPELAELLEIKLPDFGSIGWAALNELAYRLRLDRTARVLSLNVETTNFCNLRCTICPVNRGMARAKKWLDPALFERLLEQTPSARFVLPFQWGEPLLHPAIDVMVAAATKRGVRTMLTTNGTLLDEPMALRLFASGLDRLTLSVDGDDATHAAIRGAPLAEIRERLRDVRRLRDARGEKLRLDVSMVLDETTKPAIDHYRASWTAIADRVQVIPRLAARPRTKACREAWRGSLVVLVDGTVTTCCADSEGALALGHVSKDAPPAIVNNAAFRALRRRHRCGDLPAPCAGCGEFDGGDVGVSSRFS